MRRPHPSAAALAILLLAASSLPGHARPHAAAASSRAVIVMLEPAVAPGHAARARTADALRTRAARTQESLLRALRALRRRGHVTEIQPLWIVNGIAVRADDVALRALRSRAEVVEIVPDATVQLPPTTNGAAVSANLAAVNAPELWASGVTGEGVTVASLDTGVDASHPDLSGGFIGGSGWFDAYGQHAAPVDLVGHGTQTMGVMVGGSTSGTEIGVAPDARWMTARIFDDGGTASASAIHLAFQWVLDPDGDPGTDDAPRIVNSSWSLSLPGCDLTFLPDIQALRAAGILPVFAAGNLGPGASTAASPANNPGAISVGAIDGTDAIFSQSSRGPTSCGRAESVTFPELVAPGVDILSTERYGLYGTSSGTSLAAPHVSGVLALLASAFPSAPSDLLEEALVRTVRDLGPSGPDNDYGAGAIDAAAAYGYIDSLAPEIPDLLFADGFETGGTERWSATVGPAQVVPASDLDGRFALLLPLADGERGFVTDKTPVGERSIHARFRLDLGDAAIVGRQFLLVARSPNGAVAVRVEVRHAHGTLQARALTRMRNGTLKPTAWAALTDAAHVIEVGWCASQRTRANGSVVLWVDGVRVAGRWHLASTTGRVTTISLGALNAAAVGTERLDGYVSTRGSYVGP